MVKRAPPPSWVTGDVTDTVIDMASAILRTMCRPMPLPFKLGSSGLLPRAIALHLSKGMVGPLF